MHFFIIYFVCKYKVATPLVEAASWHKHTTSLD